MPLFKYFAVVGSILLAVLFVADAVVSKPKHPVFASKFDQTPPPAWLAANVAKPVAPILASETAPAPPHIAEIPAEPAAPVAAPAAAPTEVAKVEPKPVKKKVHVARRIRADRSQQARSDDSWNGSWDHSWSNSNSSFNSWDDSRSRDAFAYAPRERRSSHHRRSQGF